MVLILSYVSRIWPKDFPFTGEAFGQTGGQERGDRGSTTLIEFRIFCYIWETCAVTSIHAIVFFFFIVVR